MQMLRNKESFAGMQLTSYLESLHAVGKIQSWSSSGLKPELAWYTQNWFVCSLSVVAYPHSFSKALLWRRLLNYGQNIISCYCHMGADILSFWILREASASHVFCYIKDIKLRHMHCSSGHMLVCEYTEEGVMRRKREELIHPFWAVLVIHNQHMKYCVESSSSEVILAVLTWTSLY